MNRRRRRFPFIAMMICLLGSQVGHSRGDYCRSILVADADRADLLETVRRFTGREPDPDTLTFCRNRGELFASVRTRGIAVGDGTEQWSRVGCGRSRSQPVWRCGASQLRTFRAWPFPGLLGVWVLIHPDAHLASIQPRVMQAFASIAGSGQIDSCRKNHAPPKSHAEARALLTGGDGLVQFSENSHGIRLERGEFWLHISRGDVSGPSPTVCWDELSEADIIVMPGRL
jgi:hypothetical protein